MEIEVLRKHGFSLRRIAAEVGCAVNTVRSHLAAGTKPKYERQKLRISKLSAYETYLRERQAAAHPLWIPATVLHRMHPVAGADRGIERLGGSGLATHGQRVGFAQPRTNQRVGLGHGRSTCSLMCRSNRSSASSTVHLAVSMRNSGDAGAS